MSFQFFSSFPKCELCFSPLSSNNEKINRCANCLTLYHLECEKNFYGRNFPDNMCYKCSTEDGQQGKCFVCGIENGVMLKCNNCWIHVFCLKSLNNFFYLKDKSQYTLKISSLLKDKKKCDICSKKNHFTIHCKDCNINFHPYCAFKANFQFKEVNTITFPCNALHYLYKNDKTNTEKEEDLAETESIEKNILNKVTLKDILSQESEPEKKGGTTENSLAIPSTKIKPLNTEPSQLFKFKEERIVKTINVIDFKYLKNQMINHGVFTAPAQNLLSTTNKIIFDWKKTNSYFLNFNSEEISRVFPVQKYSSLKKTNREFKICAMLKNSGSSYYVLFDTTEVAEGDLVHKTDNREEEKNKFTFINRKRFLTRSSSNNIDNLTLAKDNIKFNRGFKLNQVSTKILALEKAAKISSESSLLQNTSFIDNEIFTKEVMLEKIETIISSIVLKIKDQMIKKGSLSKNFFNNKETELHNLSSIYSYSSIIKRLTEGVLPKENVAAEENLCECCVCFATDPNILTPIVYCDKCNVGIHQSCYGIKHIPEKEYLCDLCKVKEKNVKCALCFQSNGAMKKIDSKVGWAHVCCILISNCVRFSDYSSMDKIEMRSPIPFYSFCYLCKNKGEIISCLGCGKKYHFLCAYFEGYYLRVKYRKESSYPKGEKAYMDILNCTCDEMQWSQEDRTKQKRLRVDLYQK